MRSGPLAALWGLALVLVFAGVALTGTVSGPGSGWREFAGTWTLSGSRTEVAVEGGATAAVVEVSGAVALATGEGMSPGFRVQAIGYDDGEGTSLGRSTWTDEAGDQVFSRLEGEPFASGRKIRGTITGGTGRYSGVEGSYELTWQYVVTDEAGRIQGRSIGLAGRLRRAGGAP